MEKLKIIDHLRISEDKNVSISSFNGLFKPIDLADQLDALVKAGIVTIDWNKKIINLNFELKQLYKKRGLLKKDIKSIPSYMTKTKKDINEPFI